MALQKEKTLPNGAVGNYWRISALRFDRATMKLDMVISLYKDSTPTLAPLSVGHVVSAVLSPQELTGNLVAMAYNKIKAYANSDVPNVNGGGTHKGIADLVDATDV
jgi:hypothetical protein